MAKILGAVTTSHVPAIGNAIAKGLQNDPYWKPFFKGWDGVHAWLAKTKPDVAVVVYNDHGLQFFLDKLPTFAVGAAPAYRNADEGWGLPTLPPYRGNTDLSWHMIESLVADEFDITTCQEMVVDHAFTLPLKLMWPALEVCPVATVPVAVNTVQHPLPTPTRCYKFGRALGRAIASYPEDLKVVLLGTGGLSHQLDEVIDQAGTQGVEVINWLIARAALGGTVREVHRNYHIPISNTASGIMVLANAA